MERSFTQYIYFVEESDASWVAQVSIPVDSPTADDSKFAFAFASAFEPKATLTMEDPLGNPVDIKKLARKDQFPIGTGVSVPTTAFVMTKGMQGFYELTIRLSGLTPHEVAKLESRTFPHAIATVFNNDDVVVESFLASYEISVGKKIGVQAKLSVSPSLSARARFGDQPIKVLSANLQLMTPEGQDMVIPMNDNGVDGDLLANDGLFGAEVTATSVGDYVLMPMLAGFSEAEVSTEFSRSSQHLVAVSPARLDLTGTARMDPLTATRSQILIAVDAEVTVDTLRVYTEVYDVSEGAPKPVAWLGGLVSVINGYVAVELDHNWLVRAGATAERLVLRNTYLADVRASYPVAVYAEDIPVANPSRIRNLQAQRVVEITTEMRKGRYPLLASKRAASGKKGIILLPGYCASDNPWHRSSKDFTDAYYFDQFKLNHPHEDYARKVMAFAEKHDLDSFSLIGHSQGGKVALHIYNYYWTGLDNATGGRLIQSVGTPWEGSSAAGFLADIGNMFGIGCGANSDLTRDGAKNWKSGIQQENEEDVFFYTTTYKQGGWLGDSCSLPMNLILQWPNDGVSELAYSSLKGGKGQGNTQKWCHTTDMNYPAQYDDHKRNQEMNKLAAR